MRNRSAVFLVVVLALIAVTSVAFAAVGTKTTKITLVTDVDIGLKAVVDISTFDQVTKGIEYTKPMATVDTDYTMTTTQADNPTATATMEALTPAGIQPRVVTVAYIVPHRAITEERTARIATPMKFMTTGVDCTHTAVLCDTGVHAAYQTIVIAHRAGTTRHDEYVAFLRDSHELGVQDIGDSTEAFV